MINYPEKKKIEKKEHIFSVLDYPVKGKMFGKFKAKYPGRAAPKAFSKLANEIVMLNTFDNKSFLKFTLINLSNNKKKTYIGTRIKLHSPIIVDGKEFYYKNLITPFPKNLEIKPKNISFK